MGKIMRKFLRTKVKRNLQMYIVFVSFIAICIVEYGGQHTCNDSSEKIVQILIKE